MDAGSRICRAKAWVLALGGVHQAEGFSTEIPREDPQSEPLEAVSPSGMNRPMADTDGKRSTKKKPSVGLINRRGSRGPERTTR
jgi:hypothetical protein